jgi:hypothetical protein
VEAGEAREEVKGGEKEEGGEEGEGGEVMRS